jgi:hypothetical protein
MRQAERDVQNRKDKPERQNGSGTTEQADRDRHYRTGRAGQVKRTGSTGQT